MGKKKGRGTDQTMQLKHSAPRDPLAHNHNPNNTNNHSGSSDAARVAAEYILVKLEDCQEKDELLAAAGNADAMIIQSNVVDFPIVNLGITIIVAHSACGTSSLGHASHWARHPAHSPRHGIEVRLPVLRRVLRA